MFSQGQIVFSKCGRDKGRPFVIFSQEQEYIYLVDGLLRTVLKPKKKKVKHIQPTNTVDYGLQEKLKNGGHIVDADVRKAITAYIDRP